MPYDGPPRLRWHRPLHLVGDGRLAARRAHPRPGHRRGHRHPDDRRHVDLHPAVTDADGQPPPRPSRSRGGRPRHHLGPSLGAGEVGVAYAVTPTVNVGTGPYTWSVTGVAAGRSHPRPGDRGDRRHPDRRRHLPFTLMVTDSGQESSTQIETVPSPQHRGMGGGTPQRRCRCGSRRPAATHGGTGPYTWSVTSGRCHRASSSRRTGAISGMPATAGTFTGDRHGDRLWGRVVGRAADHGGRHPPPSTRGASPSPPTGAATGSPLPTGAVTAFGDAQSYGSMAAQHLNGPIVGIAATPDGAGLLAGGLRRRRLRLR